MDHALGEVFPGGLPSRAARTVGPAWAIVLACRSRDYFAQPLRQAGCSALVLTTGLMAPEAYVLDAALRAWAERQPARSVRQGAAGAYARFQRCPLRAAERLFAAGSDG